MANPGLLLKEEDFVGPAQAGANAQLGTFAARRWEDVDTSHVVAKAANRFKDFAAKAGTAFVGGSLRFPAVLGEAAIGTAEHPVEFFGEPGGFGRCPQGFDHAAGS